MIISERFYNIKCDNCGCLLGEEAMFNEHQLNVIMHCDNWIEVEGKHYCPDCYSRDNEGRLVINETRRKL